MTLSVTHEIGERTELSPLNMRGIVYRSLAYVDDASTDTDEGGSVEEVVMYRCKACGEIHKWEDDAEDCCVSKSNNNSTGKPACPVCGEQYHDHRDAADCCLWKDIDALTRWKMADAVERGSDWMTELGLGKFGTVAQ